MMMTRALRAYNNCPGICKPCDSCFAAHEANLAETKQIHIINNSLTLALNTAYGEQETERETMKKLREESRQLREEINMLVDALMQESKEHAHTKRELKELKELKEKNLKRKLIITIDDEETEEEGEQLPVPNDRQMLEEAMTPPMPARAWAPQPQAPKKVRRQLDFSAPTPPNTFRPIRVTPEEMLKHTGNDDCPICAGDLVDMSPLNLADDE